MQVNGIEREYIVHDQFTIKGFFGDYRWLSNFHECDVYFDGDLYASTEAAYVSAKTLDPITKTFLNKKSGITPAESKALGRKISVRDDWHKVKFDVMSAIVFDKFYRHLDLREKLLATGSMYIEETNHWGDQYWGVCDGKGENSLGRILMSVRSFWQDKNITKTNSLF